MHFFHTFKKAILFCLTATSINLLTISSVYAQSDTEYLRIIKENTTKILEKVNNLPNYLNKTTELALSWLSPDDSMDTATMQADFAALALNDSKIVDMQNSTSTQRNLAADLYNQSSSQNFTLPADNPNSILNTLPMINDLHYSSMLGDKLAPNGQFAPLNYVKYASGLTLNHEIPRRNWQGSNASKERYQKWYYTVAAIESFNAYVLSQLYAENQNGNQTSALQRKLINKASSSEWLATIASEELGKVLRQILIFQSQSYVTLTQILQTERQLLTATTMTNALLIANNSVNENAMVSTAKGVAPKF